MARGEGNILYNPPKIKKKELFLSDINFEAEKLTAYPLQDMIIKDGRPFILTERSGGTLGLLAPDKNQGRMMLREHLIDPIGNSPWALFEEGFVFQRGDKIIFQPPVGERKEFPWGQDAGVFGETLHFHLSGDDLYVLWSDANDQTLSSPNLRLSRVTRNPQIYPEWEDVFSYSGEGIVHMEKRDDKSVIFYDENDDYSSIMTIDSTGEGKVCVLDVRMERALRHDIYGFHNESEMKLTPGQEDGQYYYLDYSASEPEVTLRFVDLIKRESRDIATLSESLPKSTGISKEISDNWKDVKIRSDQRGTIIFFPGKLIYIKDHGSAEEIEVSPDYDEITVKNGMAILWSRSFKKYQGLALS